MKGKRFLCLLLATLLLFTLAPAKTEAETTVYFTAVNDQLLPDLSDGTMPFWSGGRLYVPYTAIAGTDLGLFYSRSRDKSTAVVYRQGSALTFDFAAGTVTDQNDRQYSGAAIVRGDVVFLPLDLLTQFFSLDYSYTRVTYGYLVRLKSDTVVLSDAKFIDAAAMSMEQRYNDYMKTHNGSNSTDTPPDNDRNLVCLTLRVTDESVSNTLLDTLVKENAKATFLFSEEQLSSLGDLLRRIVISGSAAALYWALKGLGKTVAVLCADPIPSRYDYMDIGLYTGQFTPGYTVAVDVAGIQLFGDSEAVQKYAQRVDLCIDHHTSNSGYASALLLDGEAAATAELLYDMFSEMGAPITPLVADCLYTGLSTDTGCFKFTNTTARTHIVAAKLMEAGANTVKLNSLLFESKSRSRLAIERLALESLEYSFGGRCATVYLTKEQIAETGADGTDLEGITSLPRMIEGVEVGITIRQQPTGSYKVSVRTVTGVDASAICAHLGGGGHKQAAGCELLGSLDNAKAALLTEVEKALCKES